MHLLNGLLVGIPGAANGTAELYQRGTSTRATWYEDFEGHGADSSGADIDLGTYGEAVVYVAELVRVVVKSAAGVTLRDWVDGVSANCVEVRAAPFTGVDYDTAKSAAGNPTNLDSVLELWDDSAGGTDWEVGSGGTPIEDAVSAVSGVFYNVKAYGAVGDGVTNDRNAINSANTAAVAAGGGTLFFPPGTYLIGSTMTMGATVSWLGAGQSVVHVVVSNAAAVLTIRNTVQGISFENSVNISGPMVSAGAITAIDCRFGKAATGVNTATSLVSLGSNTAPNRFIGCSFRPVGTSPTVLLSAADSQKVIVTSCVVESSSATATVDTPIFDAAGLQGVNYEVTGCAIGSTDSLWAGSSALFSCDFSDATPQVWTVSGCIFAVGTGMAAFSIIGDADALLQESGNVTVISGGTGVPYRLASGSWSSGQYGLASRIGYSINYATNSAVTIDTLSYSQVTITRTNNSAQTVTFTDAPPGCRCTVVYYNNQVATSGTITFDTSRVKMEAASNQFTVAADSFRVFEFRSTLIGSTLYWSQVAEDTVDEAE